MMEVTLAQVEETRFFIRLGKLAGQLVKEVYSSGHSERQRELTEAEEYTKRSLSAAAEVVSVCEQMEVCVQLLGGYRKLGTSTGRPFTRYDYLLFQLESYLLRALMLPERVLQLVNVVFGLGLAESNCRKSTVLKASRVSSSSVPSIMEAIDLSLGSAREIRHMVVHHRSLRDAGLEDVSSFYLLQKMGEPYFESTARYSSFFKRKTDEFVRSRKAELRLLNNDLFSHVLRLFDQLYPTFEQGLSRLAEPVP